MKALSVISFEELEDKITYIEFFVCGKCELVEVDTDEDGHSEPCQDCLHDVGEPCEEDKCQECCQHDERDHGICLDCEHEDDGSGASDWAYEMLKGD